MAEQAVMPQPALKYEVEVQDEGRVEFNVPFAPGARVVVFVIQEQEQDDPYARLLREQVITPDEVAADEDEDLFDAYLQARAKLAENPPRTGAEVLAYLEREGLLGTRPDITDSVEHARALRRQPERRNHR